MLRVLRYLVRTPWLVLHLFVLMPLAVLVISLPWSRRGAHGARLDHRAIRWWSAGLVRVFGLDLRRIGEPVPGAVLFVANHVSWIDIVVMQGQRMMGFVAKREISGWPLVGWMAARAETIFHKRGDSESMGGVLHEMLARLRSGRSVGVFPEGRTRDGRQLGPFHARIFLAAVEAGVQVQPVALRYGRGGDAQAVVAFQPGETFVANFFRLLGEPRRVVEVHFLAPVETTDVAGRRRIAELARERIIAAMQSG